MSNFNNAVRKAFYELFQRIEFLENTMSTVNSALADLQAAESADATQVAALVTFVGSVQSQIAALQAQITALQSANADPATIAAIEAVVNELQTQTTAVTAALPAPAPAPTPGVSQQSTGAATTQTAATGIA